MKPHPNALYVHMDDQPTILMELLVEQNRCATIRLLDLVNTALLEQPHKALILVIHRHLPEALNDDPL